MNPGADMPDDPSTMIDAIALRASELTGVNADELKREIEPRRRPSGGWFFHFTGPSLLVREAVEQAIADLKL
jgi:hypothetical protein